MAFSTAPVTSGYTLLFFTPAEASLMDALLARIIPDEPGSPGAKGAGVTEYIDHALAGNLQDLQPVYRDGLRALSAYSQARFGSLFRFLDGRLQEAVVEELDRLVTADEQAFLGQFFRIVREHTVQGYFGDPAYGGNRDAASWALIGFPGAQQRYSNEQLMPGFNASEVPIVTVNDLYRRIHEKRHGTAAAENDDQFEEGAGGDPVAVLGSTVPADRP
ncbi:gluconate 2-dehydrogenase subunit 3 family protein [Cryobacterium melibiosiphilum]|uniref:Gluconate 2-dehydrogenase subunit 3 family protein n=1 Tax=Cryobacterium melibiosiphilum TaxID=995039 RepID=A0A3A5MNM7_9MICO|nr:gluconate 2-dehydrogenase subunit 3 family protein [Cryobacterium melibiosiphilum]RJT88677.1 gluconate 2-dehydrogenase subunit 3 family protein [Cryobacterium melibiosiphilum]RJT89439.1 gluconate 2-dehydrogenase subunit 3 family protein [Cryobacterium melibiosiphilum]